MDLISYQDSALGFLRLLLNFWKMCGSLVICMHTTSFCGILCWIVL